jgi:hypothetical protein
VSGEEQAMNGSRASIQVLNHGSYTEVVIGPGELPESAYADLVARIRAAAAMPVLVLWEASCEDVRPLQTFKMGLALAGLNRPIAIVFGRREIMEADRFTELVARNRGARVRTCEDVPSAKAWLGVD